NRKAVIIPDFCGRFLVPLPGQPKTWPIYHAALASWYNNRKAVIIPDFCGRFLVPLPGQPKTWPIYHVALLHGIISTVAAHVRQNTVYSVVLFTKRLPLMLHHSQNRQSRFYAPLAACKPAWACGYGIITLVLKRPRFETEKTAIFLILERIDNQHELFAFHQKNVHRTGGT
ncbi:hypothetical protein, partial [Intestinimonas butyriciproducens]|uniref:hypothetical protein n=1 Tax=Intestinimonas butyriciproducens TaxID=1297617 RepID=UPI0019591BF1